MRAEDALVSSATEDPFQLAGSCPVEPDFKTSADGNPKMYRQVESVHRTAKPGLKTHFAWLRLARQRLGHWRQMRKKLHIFLRNGGKINDALYSLVANG